MKMKSLFAFAAVGLLGLTACSNDNDFPLSEEAGQEMRFQVDVNSLQTRASHADASIFNDFGISITSATGNQGYNWNNVQVVASGIGQSRTWAPIQPMYWKYGKQTVNVLAYTPFNADAPAGLVQTKKFPVSVSVQQGPNEYESDVLVYKGTGINPVDVNGSFKALEIPFQHVMSQLNVNVTFQGYSQAAIEAVNQITLGGTVLKGNCNFSKLPIKVTSNNIAATPITVAKSGGENQTVAYSAILVPQTVKSGKLTVAFSIDGWDYTWTSAQEYTFVENTSYTLNITANDSNTTAASIQSRAWSVNR